MHGVGYRVGDVLILRVDVVCDDIEPDSPMHQAAVPRLATAEVAVATALAMVGGKKMPFDGDAALLCDQPHKKQTPAVLEVLWPTIGKYHNASWWVRPFFERHDQFLEGGEHEAGVVRDLVRGEPIKVVMMQRLRGALLMLLVTLGSIILSGVRGRHG